MLGSAALSAKAIHMPTHMPIHVSIHISTHIHHGGVMECAAALEAAVEELLTCPQTRR